MSASRPPRIKRYPGQPTLRSAILTALGACLAAAPSGAPAEQQTNPFIKKPITPAPAQRTPAAQQQPNSLYNIFNPSANLTTTAPHNAMGAGNANNPVQKLLNPRNGTNPAGGTNRPSVPNFTNQKFTPGRPVASRNFPGHPAPPGSTETQARNGSIVRTAADGSVLDVRNPRTGVAIHHSLDGSRRITVEKPDHSRVYIPARGIQYVQHPYMYHGRPMLNRTLVVGNQTFHQLYRPYTYGNTNLDVYATTRYFAPNFYQWAGSRFNAPEKFTWNYASNSAPWFSHYRGYFTPDSSYQSPTAWLTDYVLAATLFIAYATKGESSDPPPANAAPITPEVKQMLADEVGRQVKSEAAEAQANAQNRDPAPGAGSVVQTLSDHDMHVFVVSSDLDLVDPTGRRCSMSEGDVVQIMSGPQADTGTVDAVVQTSKGGAECGRSTQVQIALTDVQEMQNHMRETMDQGMANTKAGKQAQSVTPEFAAAAPPADANAPNEIQQQEEIAAAAEG
jgi:hypothetical protein